MYPRHASRPNEKLYRHQIWYTHFPWPYPQMVFFSKKWPWRPLNSKNYRVTWIFSIPPWWPLGCPKMQNVLKYQQDRFSFFYKGYKKDCVKISASLVVFLMRRQAIFRLQAGIKEWRKTRRIIHFNFKINDWIWLHYDESCQYFYN